MAQPVNEPPPSTLGDGCIGSKRFRANVHGNIKAYMVNEASNSFDVRSIKGIQIDVYEGNNNNVFSPFASLIGTTFTDANGYFNVYFDVCRVFEGENLEIFVKILAYNDQYQILGKSADSFWNNLFVASEVTGIANVAHSTNGSFVDNIDYANIIVGNEAHKAVSLAVLAYEFSNQFSGTTLLPGLRIRANLDPLTYSSFFLPNSVCEYPLPTSLINPIPAIWMASGNVITESTTWHEFGHYLMWHLQGQCWIDPVSGSFTTHTPSNDNANTRIAWTEGWASGFMAICDAHYWQIDNEAFRDDWGWNYEKERNNNNSIISGINNGFRNEFFISCAIFDLWDGADKYSVVPTDGFADASTWTNNITDQTSLSFQQICTVISLGDLQYGSNGNIESIQGFYRKVVQYLGCGYDLGNIRQCFVQNQINHDIANSAAHSMSTDAVVKSHPEIFSGQSLLLNLNYSYTFHYFDDITLLSGLTEAFNYGADQSTNDQGYIRDNLTIQNSGTFYVNGNLQNYYPPENYPLPLTNSVMNIDVCNSPIITIQNNGRFVVGNPANGRIGNVYFKAGSTLYLKANGKLIINDGSKLIIEEGARIIYEQGAQIELLGNNAVLEIKGILELGANADFTFTYPNSVSGYVRFSRASYVPYDINDPSYQIVAPPSASIHFLGLNRTDKVLEIDQSGLWIPDWLTTFSVINGKVFFGSITSNPILAIGSPVVLKFSDFETQAPAMGQGVCLFGQSHVVQGCHFTNLQTGLTALNFYWGTPLKVTSSTFTGCGTGINVVDKGVKILACTFDNCGNGLVASGLTFPSLADATTFTNCVYDGAYLNNNPVEFLFSSCIANNNYQAGIESYGSTVNLRCNDIKQNTNWGVYIGYNGTVSANPTFGGGYNDMRFNGSSTGYFDEAGGFEFNGGYNYLKQASSSQGCDNLGIGCPTVFEGSIISSCPSNTWQTIPAYNNYWKNNLSNENVTWPPSSSSHYLDLPLSSNQLVEFPCGRFIRVSDPSQQNFLYCPTIQPPQQLTPLDNCPDCNAISTTSFSDTLSNDATRLAISKMDTTVPNGYSNAVGLLNEILLYPNANPSDGDIYVRNTGFRKMHDAFGAGMENGQIPADSLSAQALQLIQAEQDEKLDGISNGDYVKRFFASMNEAMAYRAAGKRDLALLLFYDIQSWADDVQQPYVSYWICLTNNENLVLTGQMHKEEFIAAMQLCGNFSTAVPSSQARVGDLASPANEIPGTMNTLTVFPNPANDVVTLIFNQSDPKISGIFAIYNLEGQLISTQLLTGGAVSQLDLSGMAAGLYLCTISVNGEITDRQRLAVSH
ncbi:hypothetical protein BH11BAC7_BH11BAC7_15200 [soil metagenome]